MAARGETTAAADEAAAQAAVSWEAEEAATTAADWGAGLAAESWAAESSAVGGDSVEGCPVVASAVAAMEEA